MWNILQIKITVCYFNIFLKVIYSYDGKAELLASLLQSSVSHDPSEIILIYVDLVSNFVLLSMLKTVHLISFKAC